MFINIVIIYAILSSVYSPFSNMVGLPPKKSIGVAFLRPDALSGVKHIRGMQYQIGLNITIWAELN